MEYDKQEKEPMNMVHTPLIPVLGRQAGDLSEFEASLKKKNEKKESKKNHKNINAYRYRDTHMVTHSGILEKP